MKLMQGLVMNFNSKEAALVTGVNLRRMDYWDRSHFIKPSVSEAAGYGSKRLYSFGDLVQLKVAMTLIDKGISHQKIRKSLLYLRKNMPDANKPLASVKFLTDGTSIFVLTDNTRVIIDTLKKGQLVFSIALGEIVDGLNGDVINLHKDREYPVTVRGEKYNVLMHSDDEDGGFWAECRELPGCASQGESVEEALAMIKDAIKGHIEIAKTRKKISKAS
jgi:predicted RNase H-like HicB family nuclease